MEQERTRQEGMPFVIITIYHHLAEFGHFFLVNRLSFVDDILPADALHDESCCAAGHNRGAASHICKAENRPEGPPAHAIVCRSVIWTNDVLDFRHVQHTARTDHV